MQAITNGKKIIVFETECLLRDGNQLTFVGGQTDGRGIAVDKCNNGTADDTDYAMLDGLVVFDVAALEEPVLTLTTSSKRCKPVFSPSF